MEYNLPGATAFLPIIDIRQPLPTRQVGPYQVLLGILNNAIPR